MKIKEKAIKFTTRSALVAVCVTIIVWVLPRESGPSLVYDINHPWMYPSLIATFDFPVLKDTAQLNHERDSILYSLDPYYSLDSTIQEKQMSALKEKNFTETHGLPQEITLRVQRKLQEVYNAGIIASSEYNEIVKDTSNSIRLVAGKNVIRKNITSFFSTMTAYEHIFADPFIAKFRSELQDCDINEFILPNVIIDATRNKKEKQDILSNIPVADGMVLAGQKVIDRGEIVDAHSFRVLDSYEKEMSKRSKASSSIPSTIVGQTLFVAILIVLLTIYIALFRQDYFEKARSLTMLYVLITIYPILVSLMMKNSIMNVYILPFSLMPIFIRVFLDSRTAFTSHVVMILICAAAVKYQYEFIIVQIVAGIVAIFSMRHLNTRSEIFRAALFVTLASVLTYFSLQLMQDNTLSELDHGFYKYFIINGVLLLFVYPLMLIVEKVFGFTSDVTLVEISNTSNRLLRRLSEVAPGTFQHSIMVGNLAAEIANRIGAQAQLVRTGALYHDIGKMSNPAFFTENQKGVNPLEIMSRKKAAKIIVSHIQEGLKLAEKERLPKEIKDFILTHHGRGMAKYFYIKYANEHPNEEVDKTDFSYTGPNPQTKEQAILMIADAVEAASRSLQDYSEENIKNLVNNIVDGQLNDGYFSECPLNFRDLTVTKEVLIMRLMSIYHTRITYPSLAVNNNEQQATNNEQPIN